MSVFKDIVKLWNADDLLSQAWDESYKMMMLSNEIFTQAIKYLREGENKDTIKALKKRDIEINIFQNAQMINFLQVTFTTLNNDKITI